MKTDLDYKKVAVIGGGAAGFFAAISCKTHHPNDEVIIFEKTSKLLAKVKVSGGGRCNVTNALDKQSEFSKCYPRGSKFLKKGFTQFNNKDTIKWFESRGVELKTEPDNRMFPVTNDAQTIINCLLKEVDLLGIKVEKKAIESIEKEDQLYLLGVKEGTQLKFDHVIVATGGSPKISGFNWLEDLGHQIENPAPSLFTFNMPNEAIKSLMGVIASNATVRIIGTKFSYSGPVLITHWGLSGPAILKLSAFAARYLQELNYNFQIQVNWTGHINEEALREFIEVKMVAIKKKKMSNANPFEFPSRLWEFLLDKAKINSDKIWMELGKKQFNKLVNTLTNDIYTVNGKTTFKEEFVTCGGVNLSEISANTMESKINKGLYFAGEVMDIDGITGGFNFQAAWTTGFIAGKLRIEI